MRADRLPDAIIMEEDMEISDIIKTTVNGINNTTDAVKKNTKGTSDFKSYMTKTYSLDDVFNMAADKYGISRDLLKSVAMTESCFDETAVSYCGATGLMQLMPGTARSLGVDDSADPVQNIMGGAKLLSQLLDKYDQNISLALAGYNGGTGNVAKYNGVPPFCEGYVKKVTSYINANVTVPDKTVTIDLTTGTSSIQGDTVNSTYSDAAVNYNNNKIISSDKNTATASKLLTSNKNSDTTNFTVDKATSLAGHTRTASAKVPVRIRDNITGKSADITSNQIAETFRNYTDYLRLLDLLSSTLSKDNDDDNNDYRRI